MKRMRNLLVFILAGGSLAGTARGVPTVTLTSNIGTVAEGGSITFTTTVTPSTYVTKVILSYEGGGSDEDTSYPYVINHTFNTPMDNLTVTATVKYSDSTPDGSATLDVNVVGLQISGGTTPTRGTTITYQAQSNPAGKAIDQFNWSYAWTINGGGSNTFQDNDTDNDNKSNWSGRMVLSGTLTCSATISGVNCQKSLSISITARSWPIAITCAQDNESDWGPVPITSAELGKNRDRDSNVNGYIFVPRNSSNDFSPARTLAQATSGPCNGWYYVSSSTLKCQRETVINRYIKLNGPLPSGASVNFYDANNNVCFVASDFVQAVKNHEYRGTPDTAKSSEGHQGRIERSLLDLGYDAKQHIESLVHQSSSSLSAAVDSTIVGDEDNVSSFALSEEDMDALGPNWGDDAGSLGYGGNNRWVTGSNYWTSGCANGPLNF